MLLFGAYLLVHEYYTNRIVRNRLFHDSAAVCICTGPVVLGTDPSYRR